MWVSRVQFPVVHSMLPSCSIQSLLPFNPVSERDRMRPGTWDPSCSVKPGQTSVWATKYWIQNCLGTEDDCACVTGANYKQSDTKRPKTQLPLLRSSEQKQDTPSLRSEQGNLLLIFAAVWVLMKPCLNSLSGLINFFWLRRPRTLVRNTNIFHSACTCQTYLSIFQWPFSCSISQSP